MNFSIFHWNDRDYYHWHAAQAIPSNWPQKALCIRFEPTTFRFCPGRVPSRPSCRRRTFGEFCGIYSNTCSVSTKLFHWKSVFLTAFSLKLSHFYCIFTESQCFWLHIHWKSVFFTEAQSFSLFFHWKSVFFTENQWFLLKTIYDAYLWPDLKMSGLELPTLCSWCMRSPTCPIWRLGYTVEQVTLYIIYSRKKMLFKRSLHWQMTNFHCNLTEYFQVFSAIQIFSLKNTAQ